MQKRLFDIGWSDESKCRACHEEEGTEKHRLFHCLVWHEIRRGILAFRKWEQKARTSKKEWKWQRGIVEHHLKESQWKRDHYRMEKVGVGEAQKLGHTSRRFHRSRCN